VVVNQMVEHYGCGKSCCAVDGFMTDRTDSTKCPSSLAFCGRFSVAFKVCADEQLADEQLNESGTAAGVRR
jgi:hypothetical protein